MAKNVIVIKQAGLIISKAYLDKAVKEATYLGTTLVHDGKLVRDHHGGKPTVEDVMKVQEALQDKRIIFCFGENKTILDTDRQPFGVILDRDKGDEAAVFLTGNFGGYTVKDSTHTDEYHCHDDFLSKKLLKLYRSADKDLKGLMTELNDEITKHDFSHAWVNNGFIAMMTSDGEVYHIANKSNPFMRTFDWGVTSDNLGFEPSKVQTPVAEVKKQSLLEKMLGKKAAEAPETSAAAIIAASKDNDKFEDVRLPPEANDWVNKTKLNWWVGEVGYKPDNYKDMKTVVRRTKGTKVGILAPLAATNVQGHTDDTAQDDAQDMKVDPKTLPDTVAREAPEGMKDTSPKHVTMENLPILSPKQKLKLKTEWLKDSEVVKTLGDDMKALAQDPKKLKEFEELYQKFTDGMGMPEETWLSFEAMLKLGAIDVKALAIYAFNNQNDKVAAKEQLTSILANPANKIASRAAM